MSPDNSLLVIGEGGVNYLTQVFRRGYVHAYRRYQAERGQQQTYQPPKADKQDGLAKWRAAMMLLVGRELNPLQAVRYEMRRYQALNEPEAPTLTQVGACRVDPNILEDETYAVAATAITSDLAKIKRLKTTASSLFASTPSDAQLAAEIVSSVNSHVLMVATMDATEGLKAEDSKLINLAVLEYLECPSAYTDLRLPFVVNHLKKLKDFYSIMKG